MCHLCKFKCTKDTQCKSGCQSKCSDCGHKKLSCSFRKCVCCLGINKYKPQSVGNGVDDVVNAVAVDDCGNIYVGGTFTNVASCKGIHGPARIACWDGCSWKAIATELENPVGKQDPVINAMKIDSCGNLYVGGNFKYLINDHGEKILVNSVAKWDGCKWEGLNCGVLMDQEDDLDIDEVGTVVSIYIDCYNNVVVGGNFGYAINSDDCEDEEEVEDGAVEVNNIAKWCGKYWVDLDNGIPNTVVLAVAIDNGGNVFAGLSNDIFENGKFFHLAVYNGTEWCDLGGGTDGPVKALEIDSCGNLYVGGSFTAVGALGCKCDVVSALNIAKWDGCCWSSVGCGVCGSVNALAIDGCGHLYVGGDFDKVFNSNKTTLVVPKLAKWDNNKWSSVGNGVANGTIKTEVLDLDIGKHNNIVVGGDFKTSGIVSYFVVNICFICFDDVADCERCKHQYVMMCEEKGELRYPLKCTHK